MSETSQGNTSDRDLEGKGLTGEDVIRQALECENLGPEATPVEVRKWVEWKFPVVPLPENFDQSVERIRGEETPDP